MLAKIHLKQIQIDALIGVYKSEKNQRQPLVIDLTYEVNLMDAAKTDSINSTTDYDTVIAALIEHVNNCHFHLLESLAHSLYMLLKNKFHFKSIHLTIHKPLATNGLAQVSIEYHDAYCI